MQSTEDQWTSSSSDDIVSKFWDNIADAKKAVKTWILDRHESWAPAHHNDRKRLQHIVDLMSGTPHGISQAELNET
jgi:hypothetical protein